MSRDLETLVLGVVAGVLVDEAARGLVSAWRRWRGRRVVRVRY